MKRSLIVLMALLFATAATAGGLSSREKRELRDTGYSHRDIEEADHDSEYGYKSSTGNSYKYDLSNPGDKIKYETDVGAQVQDSVRMPVNPRVDIDRDLGQYGGGLED